jgi:hypothetical protein
MLHDGRDFDAREDDREVARSLGTDHVIEPREILPEHLPVEKEQGAEGLVLRGRTDPSVDGQRREKAADLGCAHLAGVSPAVEQHVAPHPGDVGLLRPAAVVTGADGSADAIEQSRLAVVRGRRLRNSREAR